MPSCVFLFFGLIMVVPYGNRAAVATLPPLALASKPGTVKEVITDFAKQCPHESVHKCVQLIKGRTLRVIFASVEVMEDIVSGGLVFRGHPIQFKTPSVFKWVTLMDLPYGIPESEIKTALSKFGQTAHVKLETFMGLYTGTRLIKMEIKKAIPSRLVVAGHLCTIFYRGQVRSCFKCSQTGHEAKNCPNKQSAAPDGSRQREEDHVPHSRDEPTPTRREGMPTDPPSKPQSFAEAVASSSTKIGQSREDVPPTESQDGMNTSPPSSPPTFEDMGSHPQVTQSEWTDSEDSEVTRPRLEKATDDDTRDRSPLNKPKRPPETVLPTQAVSTAISPDIIVPDNISPDISEDITDLPENTEDTINIPDGQRPRVDSFLSDANSPLTDSGESSAKAGSLKTRRRARYVVRQKGTLASCIRQRTAPSLPGARKKKPLTPQPPDSPYTPLVTSSGYLVTSTPSDTAHDHPKRPDTGAVETFSPSPSSVSHP